MWTRDDSISEAARKTSQCVSNIYDCLHKFFCIVLRSWPVIQFRRDLGWIRCVLNGDSSWDELCRSYWSGRWLNQDLCDFTLLLWHVPKSKFTSLEGSKITSRFWIHSDCNLFVSASESTIHANTFLFHYTQCILVDVITIAYVKMDLC